MRRRRRKRRRQQPSLSNRCVAIAGCTPLNHLQTQREQLQQLPISAYKTQLKLPIPGSVSKPYQPYSCTNLQTEMSRSLRVSPMAISTRVQINRLPENLLCGCPNHQQKLFRGTTKHKQNHQKANQIKHWSLHRKFQPIRTNNNIRRRITPSVNMTLIPTITPLYTVLSVVLSIGTVFYSIYSTDIQLRSWENFILTLSSSWISIVVSIE